MNLSFLVILSFFLEGDLFDFNNDLNFLDCLL